MSPARLDPPERGRKREKGGVIEREGGRDQCIKTSSAETIET